MEDLVFIENQTATPFKQAENLRSDFGCRCQAREKRDKKTGRKVNDCDSRLISITSPLQIISFNQLNTFIYHFVY